MTTIDQVFEIPERVHQGDFVLKLTEGVDRADQTLRDYVVTPQLVQCFDQALGLVRSAVQTNTSKGAYLHGSFGSGKSHFMAVLSLLLGNHPAARAITELAPIVATHNAWTQGRRFLVVPFHLIGATSLESAILGGYADHVRRLHPEAPTPGFYQAERLFENARGLRKNMGDERFFATLGERASAGDAGWGAFDAAWDAPAFEAALVAPPNHPERERLVGDLVDAFFGFARDQAVGSGEGFVPLDEGLVVLTRHAKALGYNAVVIFLDELILWLASHSADMRFVNREGQKVAKLVEAGQAGRPIPLVSFLARQRDLRELVGEQLPGAEQLGFADVLNWWNARFEKITLEDRNLPAIVERRLLRPRSSEAAAALAESFETATRVREDVMTTLLTRDGDRQMFRQVYPFSPALIQTLVAVSALLQRERTALKLLLQLLVEQRHVLALGDVVPVGDLFDVIEHGDEPFTQAMRVRFDQARKLWRQKLVPMLEEEHGVALSDLETGRVVDEARARAFRGDARLLKTLLLAALADGVEALRGLTPARLAALNHGTIRSPIAGRESQIVLGKLRKWAARVGEIKITEESANPVVSLHLVGVDVEGVLENAKQSDNHGNRVQKVRALVAEMLGIEAESSLFGARTTYTYLWRGTRRELELLFRNVRELQPDDFAPEAADGWRMVVDYPFDQGAHTPRDDQAAVQRAVDKGKRPRTVAWVPAFLNASTLEELGRLVVLEHVLSGTRLDEYGAYLSQVDREAARAILANQRDVVKQRVRNALLAAYGVSTVNREALDMAHALESPFLSLSPLLPRVQPPVAATLREALEHVFGQALAAQYPAHPTFEGEVKVAAVKRVLEVVRRAAEAQDGRVEVEKGDRDDVRRIAVPLNLGRMGDAPFVLEPHWKEHFDTRRAREELTHVTVRTLRGWIDEPTLRGMPLELEKLVILTYALQTNRSVHLHGAAVDVQSLDKLFDRLSDEMELREQALPDDASWRAAVERAGAVLGVSVSPLRSATNVARLVEQVRAEAARHREGVERYVRVLVEHSTRLRLDEGASRRLRTARATRDLLVDIEATRKDDAVRTLATATLETSATEMSAVVKDGATMATALSNGPWSVLDAVASLPEAADAARGEAILAAVREALVADEQAHPRPLAEVLRRANEQAVALLREVAQRRPAPPTVQPLVPPAVQPPGQPGQPMPTPGGGASSGGANGSLGMGVPNGTGEQEQHPVTITSDGLGGRKKVAVRASEVARALEAIRADVAAQGTRGCVEIEWQVVEE